MPFPPDRTLFVAKSWPYIGLHEFTTITAALAQASIMTPTQADPVAIVIFPGTYPAEKDPITTVDLPLNLLSWVFLSSASTDQNAVTIDAEVNWTPNAPTGFEVVQLYFLNLNRTTTVDTTAKPDGATSFILHGCFLNGLTVNGRSATVSAKRDFVFAVTCACRGPSTLTIDQCLFEWVAGRVTGMTFKTSTGEDCQFRIIGSTTTLPNAKPWEVHGTAKGICTGSNFTTGWKLNDKASVEFAGCSLHSLSVAAGANADIRSSECLSFIGPGAVNRRSQTMSFGPTPVVTGPGATTTVPFSVPFPDNAYNVSLQLAVWGGAPRLT